MSNGCGKTARSSKLFSSPERPLNLLALCNIANDLGCADDGPIFISHRRDCQRNLNSFSALGDPDGLKVFNSFTTPYLAQDHGFIGMQFRRNDDGDRLPDHFFSAVSEKLLCALVPTGNNAIQVLARNCVV